MAVCFLSLRFLNQILQGRITSASMIQSETSNRSHFKLYEFPRSKDEKTLKIEECSEYPSYKIHAQRYTHDFINERIVYLPIREWLISKRDHRIESCTLSKTDWHDIDPKTVASFGTLVEWYGRNALPSPPVWRFHERMCTISAVAPKYLQ